MSNPLILLERVHPSVVETVRRIVAGECDVPTSVIRDFDGSEYLVNLSEDADYIEIGIRFSSASERTATCGSKYHTLNRKFIKHCETELDFPLRATLWKLLKRELLNPSVVPGILTHLRIPASPTGGSSPSSSDFDGSKEKVKGVDKAALEGYLVEEPEVGKALVAIRVPVDPEEPTATITDPGLLIAAQLRHFMLFSFFEVWHDKLYGSSDRANAQMSEEGAQFTMRIPYHPGQGIYLYANRGVPQCTICLRVLDPDLQLFVQAFLQEMKACKVSGSPGIGVTRGAAPQMAGTLAPVEPQDEASFWLSFSLSKRTLDPSSHGAAVLQIINFYNTILYHIGTMRSALHARMRARVAGLLQVLNRAKTKTTGQPRVEIE